MKRGFRRLMNIGTLQNKLQNRSMLFCHINVFTKRKKGAGYLLDL
jgi:hypothetical protein